MRVVPCAQKFAANDRGRVKLSRRGKNFDSAESLNPSAFVRYVDFCLENFARGIFL